MGSQLLLGELLRNLDGAGGWLVYVDENGVLRGSLFLILVSYCGDVLQSKKK